MASDAEVVLAIAGAFAHCERPEHFVRNYNHCDECARPDQLLRARDRETLCVEDVSSASNNPLVYISAQGFAYYFPALARLALTAPQPPSWEWVGARLLYLLSYGDYFKNLRQEFAPAQRQAVKELLQHLLETRAELLDAYMCADNFFNAWGVWADSDDAA